MEIEVVTTKKKLTKSIINQMEMGTFYYLDIIASSTVIGKLLNVRKGAKTVYLIRTGTGYKLINDTFYKDGDVKIRDYKWPGGLMTSKWLEGGKKFDTESERDKYWQTIKDLRRNCCQIYI